MAKDKGGAEEELDKLGRHLLQILAQEDTLKALEQKDFANQVTLVAILAQLDIRLSALRDALRGAGTRDFTTLETDIEAILARLNVNLSTRASETTLATQLNITLSALRDALKGASNKDLSTLEADLETVAGDTPALNDDSIKGLMRTMGDAGATPTNKTGKTMLKLLDDILTQVTGRPKSLADGQLAVAKATLYTVPASTYTIIKTITYVNTDTTARTVNLYICVSGGTSRRIIPKDMSMGVSYSFIFNDPLTLEAADVIEGDASVANVVDYTIHGVEET